jgi:predicted PurR-regulated permease PerM
MSVLNNENLKQYLLIGIIIILAYTIGSYLYAFFPGLLGAVTLYVLLRKYFFHLTVIKNWKKWVVATLFILGCIALFALPFVFLVQVLIPKATAIITGGQLNAIITSVTTKIKTVAPQLKINQEQIMNLVQNISSSAPMVLGSTLNMLVNASLAFFILYFMLMDGRKMEQTLHKYIPLKDSNVDDIWNATYVMVKSNAIGIPVLALAQAVVAAISYAIFGIDAYILWGVLTGICSIIPIVGIAVIWIPLCIYLTVTGHTPQAIGLAVFSLLVTGTVDNLLRFTLLKKLGDVHPIITALGIIVGIPLFGFMGFIFGPLLISYLLLLIRIYRVEFSKSGS